MPAKTASKTLNIKHPDVHRLARELADETGESMTEAVLRSLSERLERVRGRDAMAVEARIARMLELAAVMRERAPSGYWDRDFDAELYDERGLPR
ncbi:MAG TPA: type II toxin-antitoxin system VapB family antitoxin [Candidatus Limnocylindria bacterium]